MLELEIKIKLVCFLFFKLFEKFTFTFINLFP